MQCPVCQEILLMSARQGIEIDYCPKYRGVWLDRGELEKLIERSATSLEAMPHQGSRPFAEYKDDDRDRHDDSYYRGKYRKRESWLSRILDFG